MLHVASRDLKVVHYDFKLELTNEKPEKLSFVRKLLLPGLLDFLNIYVLFIGWL